MPMRSAAIRGCPARNCSAANASATPDASGGPAPAPPRCACSGPRDRTRRCASEAREERRTGREGGREDQRDGADPRYETHEGEDGASQGDRLDGGLLLKERQPLAEPGGRDREPE